ncbi:hypothetical protein NIES2100_18540 [Calothrix sp. NIES-2100]|uniref:hypothetical protein n=1 Tax=Calothrix sp. NIES-2100 TaxID=1954172 RepID=UPI000B5EA946|nr:hypothetical protein NIES2100_18540 [Calothrix sp. NIES-2100]
MTFKPVYQNVLFKKLINYAAEEKGITITAEEIQAEANRQGREKHLEKASPSMVSRSISHS